MSIDLSVIYAKGFLKFDAVVEFEPFHVHADYAAGWQVRVAIFEGGTTVSGWIDGPGPWTVHARVSIDLLIDDFSWSDTFQFGPPGAPAEPPIERLADILHATFSDPSNLTASQASDPHVAIRPRRGGLPDGRALSSPFGTLTWSQDNVPLELTIARAGGRRLKFAQMAWLTVEGTVARPVQDAYAHAWFAPGMHMTLTQAKALTLPPFQLLKSGQQLVLAMHFGASATATLKHETFIREGTTMMSMEGGNPSVAISARLIEMAAAVAAPPVVKDRSPVTRVKQEDWVHHQNGAATPVASAVHAVSAVVRGGGVAVAAADRPIPVEAI